MPEVCLLIIDPQNDFMGHADGTKYTASITTEGRTETAQLPVPGSLSDMHRLSKMIDCGASVFDTLIVSLDTHFVVDVGHPRMWQNHLGEHPDPFTVIRDEDIERRLWTPCDPELYDEMLTYARDLKTLKNYPLMVWPEHCLVGSWGHAIQIDVAGAIRRWERQNNRNAYYVLKGLNPKREHYGILMAEIPDPNDPTTDLNEAVLQEIRKHRVVAVAGEASSHCVLWSLHQIANHIGDDLSKIHVLTDCMSSVTASDGGPDFPAITERMFAELAERGMKVTTSDALLADLLDESWSDEMADCRLTENFA